MRYTFLENKIGTNPRTIRYLLGAFKLLVVVLVAAGVSAARCTKNCPAQCVCQETAQVTVKLRFQGQDITDLQSGSTMDLYVGNGDATVDFLNYGTLFFGGGNGNTYTINLSTPIPKSNLVDGNGNARVPPDASFSAFNDKLCSTVECGAGRVYRYRLLQPPTVDYDPDECRLVLTFNTQKFCETCP